MNQQKKQDVALMRYSVIAPLLSGIPDEYPSLDAYYRAVSAKGIVSPDGSVKHFSAATMERWHRNYRKGGFDALIPSGRVDEGKPRKLDHELQEQIRYFKQNYPRMPAAAIYRQLKESGSIQNSELSESTVCRFVRQLASEQKLTNNRDMRRYERPHVNEVWCGDSSYGPYLKTADGKKQRVYIIALIDDASRFIVGIDLFFNDNFINLMSVIRSAVSKYGRPILFNFDNGKSYRNRQMELLAARIGSVIHYDQPYTPTQKAKIERWFRTMKDQWMASLDLSQYHSLDELRGNLFAYVNAYNQTPHSSLQMKTPQDRFFSEPDQFHRIPEEQVASSFLLEIERRVSSDSVIVIDQTEYEVDCRFARQRIRLRYSPDMKEIFVVEPDQTLTPIRLLNKTDNAFVKREKVRLCKGDES